MDLYPRRCAMKWDYGDHMSGWGWAFMGIGMVLFWGVVITSLVLLARYLSDTRRPPANDSVDAAEILAHRFARGEISEDEFLSKAKLLKR
jgi:putative membrane protein